MIDLPRKALPQLSVEESRAAIVKICDGLKTLGFEQIESSADCECSVTKIRFAVDQHFFSFSVCHHADPGRGPCLMSAVDMMIGPAWYAMTVLTKLKE